jgi:hypothetical protein
LGGYVSGNLKTKVDLKIIEVYVSWVYLDNIIAQKPPML